MASGWGSGWASVNHTNTVYLFIIIDTILIFAYGAFLYMLHFCIC